MAKIKKIQRTVGGVSTTEYPVTIHQAVVDVETDETLDVTLTNIKNDITNKANHGYDAGETPKTLKEVDDDLAQFESVVEQLAYVKIKNEAVNGNFENGLIAPFSRVHGFGGASTFDINSSTPISGNYDIRFTITTPSTSPTRPMLYGLDKSANIGDKIYIHFYAKILSGTPSISRIQNGRIPSTIYGGAVVNGRNTRIIDVTGTSGELGIIYLNSTTAWNMQMDNFMRINLTETFGAGNEPTEEEMNLLISILGIDYFEGEITVPAQKIMQWLLELQVKLGDLSKESTDFIDVKIDELKAMYNFNYTNALPSEINEIPINETFWIKEKYFNYLNNTYPVDASFNVTKPIQLTKGVYKLFTRLSANASGVVRNESGSIVYKFRLLDVTEGGYYLNIEEDNWTLEFSIYGNDVDTVRLLKFETSVFPSKAEFNSAIKSIQNNTTLLDTRTELLENNLDVYNEQFNYTPSGTNLLTEPLVLADLRRGYRNVLTGAFIDGSPYAYYTTDKIMIPRGSKVEVKGFYNITNPGNIAVYIFNGQQYIKGIPFDSSLDEVTNEGNIFTVTIPEDMFNGSGIHSIEIAGYVDYFDRYDLKIRTYGGTVNIGNMSGGGDSASSLIKIPTLANGTEINIPHTIYDNLGEVNEEYMGNPLAKTVLRVPISSAHNVRFKFKVEEDLLRLNKTAVIFDGGGLQVKAEPVPITQQTVDFIDDDNVSQTSYLPVLIGGINYITDESSSPSRNRGEFAFSVQYTGDVNNEASIENTGSEVVLKVNSAVVADLSFGDYPKMSLLYQAIGSVTDFEVDFNELEARVPQDLAIFPEIKLVSTFKNKIGGHNSEEEIYRDAAKVHIPYSVDTNWHHVEIVSLKGITYLLIDGAMTKVFSLPLKGETDLIFGGECGVVFKDIEIDTLTTRDAEIVMYAGINETVISTMNPLIIIWEGHGMYTHASHEEEVHTGDMETTTDRLQHIFSLHKEKGYLPVSIYDIRDWYYNGKELPKRCYTVLFDDWQFDNYLNLKKRAVFTRFNVKPLICTITDRSYSSNYKWTYNGVDITAEKAFDIGRRAEFSNISHTRLHRNVTATKYSEYEQEWILDMYSADEMGVHSSMVSYPFGIYNTYMTNTFKWCGGNIAIGVYSQFANRRHKSPYDFRRLELGLRESIEKIKESIV